MTILGEMDRNRLQQQQNPLDKEKERQQQLQLKQFRQRKEREDFLKRLVEFHRHKSINAPIYHFPTFNGHQIDMHKFYSKVTSLGGWERVCEKNRWEEVGLDLDQDLFKSCTNGAHALKLIYIRYLSLYEKFDTQIDLESSLTGNQTISSLLDTFSSTNPSLLHSAMSYPSLSSSVSINQSLINSTMGLIKDSSQSNLHRIQSSSLLEDKQDPESNRRKFSYLLDTPMNYNYNQHLNVQNFNPYEKMEISLESGLPNEVDFVFNSILLLSSDETHQFRVYSSKRLIDLMLAHVGFFGTQDRFNLKYLYDNVWNAFRKFDDSVTGDDQSLAFYLDEQRSREEELRKRFKHVPERNFAQFWHNITQLPNDSENASLIKTILPPMNNQFIETLPEQDLMNLRETGYLTSVEFKRIEQVLVVLNNLSFEENNAEYMANKCPVLLEFLILCLYAKNAYSELCKHALDILANVSRRIKLKLLSDLNRDLLVNALVHLIVGEDQEKQQENSMTRASMINSNENITPSAASSSLLGAQDRMDIVRGLEILTKLCSQLIDPFDEENSNENLIARYMIKSESELFIERIIIRLEELLSVQDVLVILQTLECLYNLSQNSAVMANLMIENSNKSSKIVPILVNFLTVDMTHFGMQPTPTTSAPIVAQAIPVATSVQTAQPVIARAVNATSSLVNSPQQQQPIKMYKIVPSNGVPTLITTTTPTVSIPSSTSPVSSSIQMAAASINKAAGSLLQQTLNSQQIQQVSLSSPNSNPSVVMPKINFNQLTNPLSTTALSTNSSNNNINNPNLDQQAKNALCNWLVTCFQADPSSDLSKTQLYPYYQQTAKANKWSVLTIPTFFEILNATFPNLRYDEETNLIHGLKIVKSMSQQQQQPQVTVVAQASHHSSELSIAKVEESKSAQEEMVSPSPNLSINVQNPTIAPILTPPTPRTSSTNNEDENSQVSSSSSMSSSSEEETKRKMNNEEEENSNKSSSTENEEINISKKTKSSEMDVETARGDEQDKDSAPTQNINTQPEPIVTQQPPSSPIRVENVNNAVVSAVVAVVAESAPIKPMEVSEPLPSEPKIEDPVKSVTPTPNPVVQHVEATTTTTNTNTTTGGNYLCEWNQCNRYFVSAKAVYNHVCKQHLLPNQTDPAGTQCLWTGCDQIKRQKWSLVNHIQEKHCNENAMRTSMAYRQRGMIQVQQPSASSVTLNYNKDAAVFAIQRHQRLKREDFVTVEEGPLTKSIRLLAALNLRNLAKHSEKAKTLIKPYESFLANIAFDMLEASNAIAACLWYLNNP